MYFIFQVYHHLSAQSKRQLFKTVHKINDVPTSTYKNQRQTSMFLDKSIPTIQNLSFNNSIDLFENYLNLDNSNWSDKSQLMNQSNSMFNLFNFGQLISIGLIDWVGTNGAYSVQDVWANRNIYELKDNLFMMTYLCISQSWLIIFKPFSQTILMAIPLQSIFGYMFEKQRTM